MGDMADMCMDVDPYWDSDDPPGEAYLGYEPRTITCKHCGASGLDWARSDAGWYLVKNGKKHVCSGMSLKTTPTAISTILGRLRNHATSH